MGRRKNVSKLTKEAFELQLKELIKEVKAAKIPADLEYTNSSLVPNLIDESFYGIKVNFSVYDTCFLTVPQRKKIVAAVVDNIAPEFLCVEEVWNMLAKLCFASNDGYRPRVPRRSILNFSVADFAIIRIFEKFKKEMTDIKYYKVWLQSRFIGGNFGATSKAISKLHFENFNDFKVFFKEMARENDHTYYNIRYRGIPNIYWIDSIDLKSYMVQPERATDYLTRINFSVTNLEEYLEKKFVEVQNEDEKY